MQEITEIEKSIQKKFRKEIFRPFVKAINDFQLIKENDSIAVCISGGKDSFLLAKCLQELKKHNKFNFEIKFILMDPGYSKDNLNLIKKNAAYLNIPLDIFNSDIFNIVKTSDNPCYLCARMRRGYLYNRAKELGCNKIALGHHFNDVIETILLNQLYNGQFSGMLPILNSDNYDFMQLIRPLYYVKEKNIIAWTNYNKITFIDCACNVTKKNIGKRKEIKELIESLLLTNENADINLFNSMFNVNQNTTYVKK